ncbi:uncharacterized protein [Lepeophtheirus salmonis]|nr:protein giant-like [Lepeophtheirus salmonis]
MPPRSPDDVVVKSENEGSTPVEALRICGGTNDDGTPNNSLHHPQLHAPHHVHVQQQQVQQQVNHHHAHHTVAHELMDPSLRISGYFGGSGSISDDNSRKKKKILVSDEKKDDKYWERRRKNNMAAKRSRDARRAKENQIAIKASFLERDNKALAHELSKARAENQILRERLSKYEII